MTIPVDDLPDSVRIGPHDVRFAELSGAEARSNYGTFVPAEQAIKLLPEYASGSMAVDTVMHEIIHAIFAVGAVQSKMGEEHIVSVLATYLAQIVRDNPDLIRWMQATVNK